MYIYIYTYMYYTIYIYIYMYIIVNKVLYVYIYTYTQAYIYIYIHINVCIYIYIHIYTRICYDNLYNMKYWYVNMFRKIGVEDPQFVKPIYIYIKAFLERGSPSNVIYKVVLQFVSWRLMFCPIKNQPIMIMMDFSYMGWENCWLIFGGDIDWEICAWSTNQTKWLLYQPNKWI